MARMSALIKLNSMLACSTMLVAKKRHGLETLPSSMKLSGKFPWGMSFQDLVLKVKMIKYCMVCAMCKIHPKRLQF